MYDESFASYINNGDHKQHLNLIPFAWTVINEDRSNFSDCNKPLGLASLLNRIIDTCEKHPELLPYPVNLPEEKKQYIDTYSTLLDKYSFDSQISENIKKDLAAKYEQDQINLLKNKSKKGNSEKFRLSNEVYKTICDIEETDVRTHIFQKPGIYLKILLEEYAKLPPAKREEIYFFETVQDIREILSKQNSDLLITSGKRSFLVEPYEIAADSLQTHLYLSCYSAENTVDGIYKYKPASFRISRITKYRKTSKNPENPLTPEKIKALEEEIKMKGIAFLLADSIRATIRFTKNGLQKLQAQSYLRPIHIEKKLEQVYIVTATERQLEAYFLKFGKDAEILEPVSLRERFARHYREAAALYSTDNSRNEF